MPIIPQYDEKGGNLPTISAPASPVGREKITADVRSIAAGYQAENDMAKGMLQAGQVASKGGEIAAQGWQGIAKAMGQVSGIADSLFKTSTKILEREEDAKLLAAVADYDGQLAKMGSDIQRELPKDFSKWEGEYNKRAEELHRQINETLSPNNSSQFSAKVASRTVNGMVALRGKADQASESAHAGQIVTELDRLEKASREAPTEGAKALVAREMEQLFARAGEPGQISLAAAAKLKVSWHSQVSKTQLLDMIDGMPASAGMFLALSKDPDAFKESKDPGVKALAEQYKKVMAKADPSAMAALRDHAGVVQRRFKGEMEQQQVDSGVQVALKNAGGSADLAATTKLGGLGNSQNVGLDIKVIHALTTLSHTQKYLQDKQKTESQEAAYKQAVEAYRGGDYPGLERLLTQLAPGVAMQFHKLMAAPDAKPNPRGEAMLLDRIHDGSITASLAGEASPSEAFFKIAEDLGVGPKAALKYYEKYNKFVKEIGDKENFVQSGLNLAKARLDKEDFANFQTLFHAARKAKGLQPTDTKTLGLALELLEKKDFQEGVAKYVSQKTLPNTPGTDAAMAGLPLEKYEDMQRVLRLNNLRDTPFNRRWVASATAAGTALRNIEPPSPTNMDELAETGHTPAEIERAGKALQSQGKQVTPQTIDAMLRDAKRRQRATQSGLRQVGDLEYQLEMQRLDTARALAVAKGMRSAVRALDKFGEKLKEHWELKQYNEDAAMGKIIPGQIGGEVYDERSVRDMIVDEGEDE